MSLPRRTGKAKPLLRTRAQCGGQSGRSEAERPLLLIDAAFPPRSPLCSDALAQQGVSDCVLSLPLALLGKPIALAAGIEQP